MRGLGSCAIAMLVGCSSTSRSAAPDAGSGNISGNKEPVSRTISVNSTGPGAVDGAGLSGCRGNCSFTATDGAAITLTAAPDPGAVFSGWSGACSGTGSCAFTASSDAQVTATFAAVPPPPAGKHNLFVSKNGAGSIRSSPAGVDCGSTCAAAFDDGTLISLTATPDANFRFAGWGGACSGGGSCSVALRADATVYATFEPVQPVRHTLTVSRNGNGRVTSTPLGIDCGGTCSAQFDNGQVSLSAAPDAGWTFAGWSGACSGTGACSISLSSDVSVSASFTASPIAGGRCPAAASDLAPAPLDATAPAAAAPPRSGGPSCDGLSPPADVAMREYVTQPASSECLFTCLPGAADATGLLAFARILGGSTCHASVVDFVTTSGAVLGPAPSASTLDVYLTTLPQPTGFLAAARSYLGPSPLPVLVSAWDASGHATSTVGYQAEAAAFSSPYGPTGPTAGYQEAIAPHPLGGAVVAGNLRLAVDAPFQHVAVRFAGPEGAAALGFGPVPLDSDGEVLGVGVDVLGRSLVLTLGASRFGAGTVAAQWFDGDGTPLTCAFALLEGYAALGERAWLEAVPLVGGGVAVRRADLTFPPAGASVQRRWVAVVEGGAARFAAPPAWMSALRTGRLALVHAGRAYALLPDGASAAPCTQHVEVLAADGTSCGGRDYPIAEGSCATSTMSVGADGTVIQQLPTSLEPSVPDPRGGVRSGCTWRWWEAALR